MPEDVAVELLVDAYDVTVVHRVHGVAAAAEVDEIEEREVILELLEGNREPRCELAGIDHRGALVTARGQKVCEERLQDAEAFRGDRPQRSLWQRPPRIRPLRSGCRGRRPGVRLGELREPVRDRLHELIGLDRYGTAVLAQDPSCEQVDVRVLGLEHSVLDRPRIGERSLDPPRGVVRDGDTRRRHRLSDLPRPGDSVFLDVEVGGDAEVALAPGGEPDVPTDA